MQIRVEVSENIIVYREGSSIKTMLRKTDSETSRMPIYGNFSIEKQVGVGFSDDKRMEGKVFNLDIIADKNIPLGPYLIKGVGLAEEIIRGRRLKESIMGSLRLSSEKLPEDLLLIPSRIVLSSSWEPVTFGVLAKENAILRCD